MRYWSDFEDLVAGVAETDEAQPLADPVGAVLDVLIAGFRARPGFLALWYGGLRTEQVRDATRPTRTAIARSIERILAVHWPRRRPRDSARRWPRWSCSPATDCCARRSGATARGDATVLAESKVMLRRLHRGAPRLRRRRLWALVVAMARSRRRGQRPRPPPRPRQRPVFALIPTPGYPALPHVVGDAGLRGHLRQPARRQPDPSRVFEYTADGTLLRTFTVQGQDLRETHGVQVAANDAAGPAAPARQDERPDHPPGPPDRRADAVRAGARPADVRRRRPPAHRARRRSSTWPPMPDYAAWGTDGEPVRHRLPAGGDLAHPTRRRPRRRVAGRPAARRRPVRHRLHRRWSPDHRTLLFDQASNGGLGTLAPTTGKLYTVPIQADGDPGPLTQLWESGPADAPDGCAVARLGPHLPRARRASRTRSSSSTRPGARSRGSASRYTGANDGPVAVRLAVGRRVPRDPADHRQPVVLRGQHRPTRRLLALETGEAGAPVFVPCSQ